MILPKESLLQMYRENIRNKYPTNFYLGEVEIAFKNRKMFNAYGQPVCHDLGNRVAIRVLRTSDRHLLHLLDGVDIHLVDGVLYLNGQPWKTPQVWTYILKNTGEWHYE